MQLYENRSYCLQIEKAMEWNLPWEKLNDKSILISGAAGMIGSCLIDIIMLRNKLFKMNCKVYAVGRNLEKIKNRFEYCCQEDTFQMISWDINQADVIGDIGKVDYVLHLASNTHPVAYATDPIGTITTNIIGTHNLLEFAVNHDAARFVFASSNEIYGENRGDVELFDEEYCGYIDCNTMRAGYPESKRCGEALCQAYMAQKDLDIAIARLTRSYGPTLLTTDTKALSQFIKKGIEGEDIVLKSEGTQFYSYTYVLDAVSGLLTVLLCGERGEAYNIADVKSDITLRDLAKIIADYVGVNVVFEIPDAVEQAGYSKATKARLNSQKLQALGWKAEYSIQEGLQHTIDIMKGNR